MASVSLEGSRITSVADFHRELAALLDFGPYYGANLDALWDRLSTDVPRPVDLVWVDAGTSRAGMGSRDFEAIRRVLDAVVADDACHEETSRFTYRLA